MRNVLFIDILYYRLKPGRNSIDDNRVEVILGLHNRLLPEDQSILIGHNTSLVIFLHEDYNSSTLENDIAMIQFSHEIEFNEFIKPICLPSVKESRLLRGTSHIAGWGRNSTRDRDLFPDVLQDSPIPVVNIESCKKVYEKNIRKITDRHICAGKNGTDACAVCFKVTKRNRHAIINLF